MTNCYCDEPQSSASELLESAIVFVMKQGATTPEEVLEGLRNISEKDFWMLWKDTFPDLAAREEYFDKVWDGRDKFLASRGEYFENTWGGEKFLLRRIGRIIEETKQEAENPDRSDTVAIEEPTQNAVIEYDDGFSKQGAKELAAESMPIKTSTYEGTEAIKHFLDHDIKLIGVYESGAYIAKGDDFETAFTSDIKTIKSLINGEGDKDGRAKGTKIERFRFCPANAGFLCIDIDRGHDNGVDGLSEFYKMFEDSGIYRPGLPKMLQDIEHGSFPVYTATPSGGFHLYFRYKGQALKKCVPAPNVEIFHTKSYLAAPGSYKNGKPYILYGNLDDTPNLPPFIEKRLRQFTSSEQQNPSSPKFTYNQTKEKSIPTLDQIAVWAESDGNYSGKNEFCFAFARRAARTDYHYSQSEVVRFLENYPSTRGHNQIKDAVRSAFKYKR